MEKYEEYYRLGIRYADKIIEAVFSEQPHELLKKIIIKNEVREKVNRLLVHKEYSYFLFNILTTLIGLNKELIEEREKNANYMYDINKKLKETTSEQIKFSPKVVNEDKYDSWLNVTNYSILQSDLIFNVRNGILHSEFEPSDASLKIYNIRNSNYTNFEAEIYFPTFLQFIFFYFGNSNTIGYVTLKTDIALIKYEEKQTVKNENDLEKLLNSLKIAKPIAINNNNNSDKTIEAKLNQLSNESGIIYGHDDMFDEKNISHQEKQIIKKIISKKQNIFYSLDFDSQIRYIGSIYNFINYPNFSISNWITYYSEILVATVEQFNDSLVKMSFGTGLDKIAAIFIKLSFIIYRIQHKGFKEIDYNLLDINLDNIKYTEDGNVNGLSPFIHAYNKFKNQQPYRTDKEIKLQIICDIIRNSVAHGKLETKFDVDDGETYIKFIDSYKGKKRTLTLNADELKKFVMSKAFESVECVKKENKSNSK